MSNDGDDIKSAALRLTDAMSGLLRAIDAVGDEGATATEVPDNLPGDLERLAARLNAAKGYRG